MLRCLTQLDLKRAPGHLNGKFKPEQEKRNDETKTNVCKGPIGTRIELELRLQANSLLEVPLLEAKSSFALPYGPQRIMVSMILDVAHMTIHCYVGKVG